MVLKEGAMRKDGKEDNGMTKLLCYYKGIFRTPENLNHYSESDLRAAEKKFLKYVLLGHGLNKGEGEMGS
jgi:hypothetical protein